jgi:hypothetical protein
LEPEIGDVVVLTRDTPYAWAGHVGLFIRLSENKEHVFILGGNQQNSVNVSRYQASRVLGYRRLSLALN